MSALPYFALYHMGCIPPWSARDATQAGKSRLTAVMIQDRIELLDSVDCPKNTGTVITKMAPENAIWTDDRVSEGTNQSVETAILLGLDFLAIILLFFVGSALAALYHADEQDRDAAMRAGFRAETRKEDSEHAALTQCVRPTPPTHMVIAQVAAPQKLGMPTMAALRLTTNEKPIDITRMGTLINETPPIIAGTRLTIEMMPTVISRMRKDITQMLSMVDSTRRINIMVAT